MKRQKRIILACMVMLLIACNCVVAYAGDVYGDYGGNARGYFTYTNAWLEMNNGEYIDSPIGH